ncbi:MAG: HGGxSTG domain-containing protein [Halanaerobiales bacterium]
MPKQKQPHGSKCGAKAKSTGEPCKLPAGYGTDHLGEGRCKYHGGKSKGPPEKNKNAVKTGEYETIWLDTLDTKEQELYSQIRTDVVEQLDNEIRLTDIRIRRMMMRISSLRDKEFTIVESKHREGFGPEGPVNVDEDKKIATLGQIQNIEDALTRVQSRKEKLLKLKHQIESGQGPVTVDISNYINAIGRAAEEVWEDEEE